MGLERARAHLSCLLGRLGNFRQEGFALRVQSRRSFRNVSVPITPSAALPLDVEHFPPRLASEWSPNLLLCNRRGFLRRQHDQLCDRYVTG